MNDFTRAEFTKPPWKASDRTYVGKDGGLHGYREIVSDSHLFWIARVLYFDEAESKGEKRYKNNVALIEAAPEMYAVLCGLIDAILNPDRMSGVLLGQAEAVLAKINCRL